MSDIPELNQGVMDAVLALKAMPEVQAGVNLCLEHPLQSYEL